MSSVCSIGLIVGDTVLKFLLKQMEIQHEWDSTQK